MNCNKYMNLTFPQNLECITKYYLTPPLWREVGDGIIIVLLLCIRFRNLKLFFLRSISWSQFQHIFPNNFVWKLRLPPVVEIPLDFSTLLNNLIINTTMTSTDNNVVVSNKKILVFVAATLLFGLTEFISDEKKVILSESSTLFIIWNQNTLHLLSHEV